VGDCVSSIASHAMQARLEIITSVMKDIAVTIHAVLCEMSNSHSKMAYDL